VKKALTFENIYAEYNSLLSDRSEWESEWRRISRYLVPGRGIFDRFSKPTKRYLTSPAVINNTAEDALYVLTSGIHGALTSPSRPWFRLEWASEDIMQVEPLVMWLQQCEQILQKALQISNFYPIVDSFYVEYCAFGTGCLYIGEDALEDGIPFRFELLTAGEYAFALNSGGVMDKFYRTLFMTPRKMYQKFGNRVASNVKTMVKQNKPGVDSEYHAIIEAVLPEPYKGMPFTQIFYDLGGVSGSRTSNSANDFNKKPLHSAGFYEMPYKVARWSTIGSDIYGIGPGARAMPDIKRLQEMEKAFLMAAHKNINPPLNAPGYMKGKLNTLPGGKNYYRNPQDVVRSVYEIRFDYQGVTAAIERVEERIKKNFFNDIFLIPGRGPDKSPLKATEVTAREQEKMLRLGPVVERLQHEFLQPLIQRCFNILQRNGFLPELPGQYADMFEEMGYNVVLISPMATAQRSAAIQGLNSFLGYLANAAQFKQDNLDNVDTDAAAREVADVNGVNLGILRPQADVDKIRKDRMRAMQEEKKKQEQMQMLAMQAEMQKQTADARKSQAEAGATLTDATVQASEAGMM